MHGTLVVVIFLLGPGRYFLEHGRYENARRYYDLQTYDAINKKAMLGSAICALALNDIENAYSILRHLIRIEPDAYLYLGIIEYRKGDYESAHRHLGKYREYRKNSWPVEHYLGLISFKQGNIDNALQHFRSISDHPETYLISDYARDYQRLVISRDAYQRGDYTGVIENMGSVSYFTDYRQYGTAISYIARQDYASGISLIDSMLSGPVDPDLQRAASQEAARICLLWKEPSRARGYLEPFINGDPSDTLLYLIGRSYSDEMKYDSAAIYFNGLPDTVDEYLFFKGRTAYFRGLWGSAEEMLLCHRQYFPESGYRDRALYIIASINFRRKEFGYAIDFWTELITSYPESNLAASAQKGIADAFFELADFPSALSAYQLVKKYESGLSIKDEVDLRIYETRFHLKEYRSLADALSDYLNEHPDSKYGLRTRLRIVNLLMEKRELYAGLSEIEQIINLYADSTITSQAYLDKARVYEILGLRHTVKNIYIELLERRPEAEYLGQALSEMASLYYQEERYDSALYYYNQLSGIAVYQERAWYEIAKIYDQIGQDNEAETVIDRLIEKYPLSAFLFDAVFLKTGIFEKRGQYKMAIDLLTGLIDKVGERPEIYLEIGNIYFQIEDYPNAHKYYLVAAQNYHQRRNDVARALMLAGDAMAMIGDKRSALEHYLQAKLIAESAIMKNQLDSKINDISN